MSTKEVMEIIKQRVRDNFPNIKEETKKFNEKVKELLLEHNKQIDSSLKDMPDNENFTIE